MTGVMIHMIVSEDAAKPEVLDIFFMRLKEDWGADSVRAEVMPEMDLESKLLNYLHSPKSLNRYYVYLVISPMQFLQDYCQSINQLAQHPRASVYLVATSRPRQQDIEQLHFLPKEQFFQSDAGDVRLPSDLEVIRARIVSFLTRNARTEITSETRPHVPVGSDADTRPHSVANDEASAVTHPYAPIHEIAPIQPEVERPQSAIARGYRSQPVERSSQRARRLNKDAQSTLDLGGPESAQYVSDVVYKYQEPSGLPYPYPHIDLQAVKGVRQKLTQWVMAGASIRGRSHQHDGTYRDDAFRLVAAGRWHIIAVADGAGSAVLSRVTANESVSIATQTLQQYAAHAPNDPDQAVRYMQQAMEAAVRAVMHTQKDWTAHLNATPKETYTTFMLLLHQVMPDESSIIGRWHVGDGFMGAFSAENRFSAITEGDHGADASTTYFVLSFSEDALIKKILIDHIPQKLTFFAVMTDGIEDDLKPSTEAYQRGKRLIHNAENWVRETRDVTLSSPCWQDWKYLLHQRITYIQKGSKDDRTLVVLSLLSTEYGDC